MTAASGSAAGLARRAAQLAELAQHLQHAREDERERLARDLHDELGALLTSAKLDAARIKARLAGMPEALERLAHLVATLDDGIALKRRIIEDLRPSALGALGLVEALQIMAREFAAQSGLAVTCTLAEVRLAPEADLVLYRVVQEAFTNIARHAAAKRVWLRLARRSGRVALEVRDDGIGLVSASGAPAAEGHGLVGMRFRVEAQHGTLALAAAPGGGLRLRVRLPELTPA